MSGARAAGARLRLVEPAALHQAGEAPPLGDGILTRGAGAGQEEEEGGEGGAGHGFRSPSAPRMARVSSATRRSSASSSRS